MHKINVLKYLIDVFTTDNITQVGDDVSITPEGIASGFSNNSYLTSIPQEATEGSSYEWNFRFKIGSSQAGGDILAGYGYYTTDAQYYGEKHKQYMQLTATLSEGVKFTMHRDSGWRTGAIPTEIVNGATNTELLPDTWYTAKIKYNNDTTSWEFFVTDDDGDFVEYTVTTGTRGNETGVAMVTTSGQRIGQSEYKGYSSTTKSYFNGSIDLYNSYILKDGEEWWTNKDF